MLGALYDLSHIYYFLSVNGVIYNYTELKTPIIGLTTYRHDSFVFFHMHLHMFHEPSPRCASPPTALLGIGVTICATHVTSQELTEHPTV